MSTPNITGAIVCTVGVERPMVCGSPHTRLRIGRADKPGVTIIDWPSITALRHNHPQLAAQLESGAPTHVLSADDLRAICRLSTFNAWPEPVPAVLNPRPHYIDMLPQPLFTRHRKA